MSDKYILQDDGYICLGLNSSSNEGKAIVNRMQSKIIIPTVLII